MDEPLSSLDAKLREELRIELKRIQLDLGATILYVTHDQVEAMTLADRIGVLSRGRAGADRHAARRLRAPADTYVARRLGSPPINLLPAGALGVDCRRPPGAATIGIRPEDLVLAPRRRAGPRAGARASRRRDAWRCSRSAAGEVHALLGAADRRDAAASTTTVRALPGRRRCSSTPTGHGSRAAAARVRRPRRRGVYAT